MKREENLKVKCMENIFCVLLRPSHISPTLEGSLTFSPSSCRDRIIQFIETTNSTRNKSMCASIKSKKRSARRGKGNKKTSRNSLIKANETMRGEIKQTAGFGAHTIWSRGSGRAVPWTGAGIKSGYQSNIKVSTFNKLSFSVKRERNRPAVVKRGNRNKNF